MDARDDALLSERLAALPLETPAESAWGQIRERLHAPARPGPARASPWWLALAAGLSLALVLPLRGPVDPLPGPSLPAVSARQPELAALMQRSRSLEAEIRGLREASPELAEAQYQWERSIEDDLALVAVGLAADSSTETLWRERVRLLEELRSAAQPDNAPLLLQARLD